MLGRRLQPNKGGPRNVYLLAGPPGVGKTFMAQTFARKLGYPFKRFDMSGYATEDAEGDLQGWTRQYRNTDSGGALTEFVDQNPRCVLLFDEIEKADRGVILIFLQILDEGVCRDRFHEKNVSFQDTVIIESKCFRSQLENTYKDVCCQVVMETLTARHQVLTYETKKEFDEKTHAGSIIFCDFKLETAVESEDKSSMLSDDLRPHKSWDDIYVSEDIKKELEFFIHITRLSAKDTNAP